MQAKPIPKRGRSSTRAIARRRLSRRIAAEVNARNAEAKALRKVGAK